MDVEDWFHLDYFQDKQLDRSYSMLDGFTNYVDLLNQHNIKTTFFVLSELAETAKDQILYADSCGHEIACHGKTHQRPLTMSIQKFERELREAKNTLEDLVGKEVVGYRAPCYSIDNERYELLRSLGFKYSSSRMDVPGHPLYGHLDLSSYNQPMQGIYEKDGFYEFALSTKKFFGKNIAISGGGWIRLLPWACFMKPILKAYFSRSEFYTLYIHPFELSKKTFSHVVDVPMLTMLRAQFGRGEVASRIESLLEMMQKESFQVLPFGALFEQVF